MSSLTELTTTINEKLRRLEILEARNEKKNQTVYKYKANNIEKTRASNAKYAKLHYDRNKDDVDFKKKKSETALKSYYKKKALKEEVLKADCVSCECECDSCEVIL